MIFSVDKLKENKSFLIVLSNKSYSSKNIILKNTLGIEIRIFLNFQTLY